MLEGNIDQLVVRNRIASASGDSHPENFLTTRLGWLNLRSPPLPEAKTIVF